MRLRLDARLAAGGIGGFPAGIWPVSQRSALVLMYEPFLPLYGETALMSK